jgi:hypothetical protein
MKNCSIFFIRSGFRTTFFFSEDNLLFSIFGLDLYNRWLFYLDFYILVVVGFSGILKGKQKLGVTFDSDKVGVIDFTKFSKLTMCSV